MEVSRKVRREEMCCASLTRVAARNAAAGLVQRGEGGRRDEGRGEALGKGHNHRGLGLGLGWAKRQQTGRGTGKEARTCCT